MVFDDLLIWMDIDESLMDVDGFSFIVVQYFIVMDFEGVWWIWDLAISEHSTPSLAFSLTLDILDQSGMDQNWHHPWIIGMDHWIINGSSFANDGFGIPYQWIEILDYWDLW